MDWVSFFPLCGKKEKNQVNLVNPVKEFKSFLSFISKLRSKLFLNSFYQPFKYFQCFICCLFGNEQSWAQSNGCIAAF